MKPSFLLPDAERLERAVAEHLRSIFGVAPPFTVCYLAHRWLVTYSDPTARPQDPGGTREILAQIRFDASNGSGLVFDVLSGGP